MNIVNIVSRNRMGLMGVATLSVLLVHLRGVLLSGWFSATTFDWFSSIIYTPGFLFLSGFGCYFSLEKNEGVLKFYKKRLIRIFPAFILITGTFLTLLTITNHDGFLLWIARITTVSYWIEGNVAANWYISVSILMYLLAPLFYHFMRGRWGYISWFILFIGFLTLIEALKRYVLDDIQYERVISATLSPSFLFGMLTAKMKNVHETISTTVLLSIPLLFLLIRGIVSAYSVFTFLPVIFPCIISLILCSLILDSFTEQKRLVECGSSNKSFKIGGRIIQIFSRLGRCSLEVYLLHTALWCFFDLLFPNNRAINIICAEILSLFFCEKINRLINLAMKY